jgi:SagB-type dehydrogenase family enzyme
MSQSLDGILEYHQRTKHQLNGYAKGPASLDWDDQPNPFRRFTGCESVVLPPPGTDLPLKFADLDNPADITVHALTIGNLGLLLELAFGLSAWKQYGPDRWALRCNPSSGNLHPTEIYIICTDTALLLPGVYHYVSYNHHLERRNCYAEPVLTAGLYLGLSSIHWREAWKYGERAFRYCQHDTGHALAALSYAAACLGWTVELCSETSDSEIASWLGLDRPDDFVDEEREFPDLLCRLHYDGTVQNNLNSRFLSQITQSAIWYGKAERLSGRHFYHWPVIDEVAAHAQKPQTIAERKDFPVLRLPTPSHNILATSLIRQRRSAQQFNGKAENLPMADFYRILAALLPNAKPPFSAWNWQPDIHLIIFVHRVEGLGPGLYLLPRCSDAIPQLQQALSGDFIWEKLAAPFDLYKLISGNVRQSAKTLSCHQPIASDSAFSLGMIARFSGNIEAEAWRYRRLFWECGMIGQILYLEAEAAGVRGTGIGCFFDDAMHGVLGLQTIEWQSLYHFTIGEPFIDGRLQSFPAYDHLKNDNNS